MPAEPVTDNCWLCSKPLEPSAEVTERVCPHCLALNKPRPAVVAPRVDGDEERCRLCLQPLDTSPENLRRVCANCGEVNQPHALPPEVALPDPAELEALELHHRRLYGMTLGISPLLGGAALGVVGLITSSRRSEDWLVMGIGGFVYTSVAAFFALLWKLIRSSTRRGDVFTAAAAAFGVSVVAMGAVLGVLILLTSGRSRY